MPRNRTDLPGDGTGGYYSQEFLYGRSATFSIGIVILRFLKDEETARRIAAAFSQTNARDYIQRIEIVPGEQTGGGSFVRFYVTDDGETDPRHAMIWALKPFVKLEDIIPGYQEARPAVR